jgi:hypothetical protein
MDRAEARYRTCRHQPLGSRFHCKIKTIGSKDEIQTDKAKNWVLKFLPDGSALRYKVRLVIQGYRQKKGIDYTETFSPVVRPETLRLVLALSIDFPEIEVEQLDKVTASLHGELNENIYMNTPEGTRTRSKVVRLLKSLYGLKQAPINWHTMINDYLVQECGFTKIKSTQCLYVKRNEQEKFVIVVLYVDDLTLVGDKVMIDNIKHVLKSRFDVTDLGSIRNCIGIQVA